ncbi:MAG: hypothetical protein GX799_04670 [Crenarchaeota archaeon]|nr:hypothetical protein [Thermoproteota archaeon]
MVFGITYKVNDIVKSNPGGRKIVLDEIPIFTLPSAEIDKYPSFKSGSFHIQNSRGCPHKCGFCYNSTFNKNRWRGKSAKRVLDEIQHINQLFPYSNYRL